MKQNKKLYNIGEFAKICGVSKQTIRNWEKEDKLTPIRLESGHRRFSQEHISKIKGNKENKINQI